MVSSSRRDRIPNPGDHTRVWTANLLGMSHIDFRTQCVTVTLTMCGGNSYHLWRFEIKSYYEVYEFFKFHCVLFWPITAGELSEVIVIVKW